MKKIYLILPVVLAAFFTQIAVAASQDLNKLLTNIKADIDAKRLSSPAGNNALEKIEAYRKQAPYDFKVVPLVYTWGEAYVALANNAIDAKEYSKASGYLNTVWPVAALTPGLEQAQAKLDAVYKPSAAVANEVSPQELERQRQLAEAATKEKAREEADRQARIAEEKRQAELTKKKAAEDSARRQEEERLRRLATEKAAADKASAATVAAAKPKPAPAKVAVPVAAPVVAPVVVAPVVVPKPAVIVAPVVVAATAVTSKAVTALWNDAEESSEPIATYAISAEQIRQRDRNIANTLQPICKAIVDNDASVVVHTENKSDYRWLTVRLTLCLRQTDGNFRLRHSYQEGLAADSKPYISLHPSRDVSLLRQTIDEQ